jgi:hypothetical protein
MATKSVTTRASFHHLPLEENYLFEVREGIDASSALSHADVLSAVVQELLLEATDEENALTGNMAYFCEFAMETAKALRTAAGAVA